MFCRYRLEDGFLTNAYRGVTQPHIKDLGLMFSPYVVINNLVFELESGACLKKKRLCNLLGV